MPTVFRHRGETVDYTPVADVAAGDVVVVNDLVAVAKLDIKTGTLGALSVEGVFDFPKATGASTAIAGGTKVYWDDTAKVATTDDASGANKLIGKTVPAGASDSDESVRVRLNQ